MTVNINTANALRRALRTVLQFLVSGGLTAVVTAFAGHFNPLQSAALLAGFQMLVTFSQNYLESTKRMPTILAPKSALK